MMTAMERLVAAASGQPVDRCPVFCNLLDQGAAELGLGIEDYYQSGQNVAEGQLRMRERYGYDNVWCLFYVGREAELLGCKKVRFYRDGPPNVEDFVIKSHADVYRLEVPNELTDHPAFIEQARCLSILRSEVKGRYPICAYVTATMALPALLMGMDAWMELLLLGPASVRDELLEKCHRFFVKEVRAMRAGGVDVIVYSNPFGSTDFVSMKYFTEHSLPSIERDIKAVGTEGMVFYCGMARFNQVIEQVLVRTGLKTYYLSPLDDLREGKRLIAGRGLTCGVINDIKLIDWSPQEIRHEVKSMMEAGAPGGRFLFGTGVMPCAIPERNILTMLEAAFEYGAEMRSYDGRVGDDLKGRARPPA